MKMHFRSGKLFSVNKKVAKNILSWNEFQQCKRTAIKPKYGEAIKPKYGQAIKPKYGQTITTGGSIPRQQYSTYKTRSYTYISQ